MPSDSSPPTVIRCSAFSQRDLDNAIAFKNSASDSETEFHQVLKHNPGIVNLIGFSAFLDEFKLRKRGPEGDLILDPRRRDRADLLVGRDDGQLADASYLTAHILELKSGSLPIYERGGTRFHSRLLKAVEQLADYEKNIREIQENRAIIETCGFRVLYPRKILLAGSREEFHGSPQLWLAARDRLEAEYGVLLLLWDDVLDRVVHADLSDLNEFEALIGYPHVSARSVPAVLVVRGGGLSRLVVRLANGYGSIDVRGGVPTDLLHVIEPRIQPVARRLSIPYATALVGFTEYMRDRWQAQLEGIVIERTDEDRLRQALDARATRSEVATPYRKRYREQKQAERVEAFRKGILERFPGIEGSLARSIALRACEIGSGRIGTKTGIKDPFTPAVGAYLLHEVTNYHRILDEVHEEYRSIERKWRRYLDPPAAVAREKVEPEVQSWLAAWKQGRRRP